MNWATRKLTAVTGGNGSERAGQLPPTPTVKIERRQWRKTQSRYATGADHHECPVCSVLDEALV